MKIKGDAITFLEVSENKLFEILLYKHL